MIAAVLDSNVLASGLVGFRNPASTPGGLLRAWRQGAFQLVASEPILAEVGRTLQDPSFRRRLSPRQISAAQKLLRGRAILTPLTAEVRGVATHPADDLILATAVSARADYLVTGDAQLQKLGSYEGVAIVSPRRFLEQLAREGER